MALQKSIKTRFGINAEYRNIAKFDHQKSSWTINIILAGYSNEEGKIAWSNALDTRNYHINSEELDEYFGFDVLNIEGENHFKKAYEYIKNKKIISTDSEGESIEEDGEFADALDV